MAYSQIPERSGATQIWKISHAVHGSVAHALKLGKDSLTLEFPQGPIQSGKNIDLPPIQIKLGEINAWSRWSIPAHITIKEAKAASETTNLPRQPYKYWRLFARLKDGRIVPVNKMSSGIDGGSFQSPSNQTRYHSALFVLTTGLSTRSDFHKKEQKGEGVVYSEVLLDKPLPWRDVSELWFYQQ